MTKKSEQNSNFIGTKPSEAKGRHYCRCLLTTDIAMSRVYETTTHITTLTMLAYSNHHFIVPVTMTSHGNYHLITPVTMTSYSNHHFVTLVTMASYSNHHFITP